MPRLVFIAAPPGSWGPGAQFAKLGAGRSVRPLGLGAQFARGGRAPGSYGSNRRSARRVSDNMAPQAWDTGLMNKVGDNRRAGRPRAVVMSDVGRLAGV